jgi:hypothetical protein
MNNENSATAKMPQSVAQSAEKSEILAETYSKLKAEIKDEAQHIFGDHRGSSSKTKTLTEACATMKEEIKDEAKRLVPDLGNQH